MNSTRRFSFVEMSFMFFHVNVAIFDVSLYEKCIVLKYLQTTYDKQLGKD